MKRTLLRNRPRERQAAKRVVPPEPGEHRDGRQSNPNQREHWLPDRAWRGLLPAALFIHGPGLLGLLLLTRNDRTP